MLVYPLALLTSGRSILQESGFRWQNIPNMRSWTSRPPYPRPKLDEDLILSWADTHFEATGEWPKQKSGRVIGQEFENWLNIDHALRKGHRGLLPDSSLAILLEQQRSVPNHLSQNILTEETILEWADEHYRRHGDWPKHSSGQVDGRPRETWRRIDADLRAGLRGLPGKSTLANALFNHRSVVTHYHLPHLTVEQITSWAEAHFAANGEFPTASSGVVGSRKDETWRGIDTALRRGLRGLPGGDSLPGLLKRQGKHRKVYTRPKLSIGEVLAWADDHYALTGKWPTRTSGIIPGSPAVAWSSVDRALRHGLRSLPGGGSLSKLLTERRGYKSRERSLCNR